MLNTSDIDYVVYTDTDSIYVNMEPVVEKCGFMDKPTTDTVNLLDDFCEQKMQPIIDKAYQELAEYTNAYQQKMFMDREVISDNSVFCAKKRYAMNVHDAEGVRFAEPYLKTMGLDVVKSSTPQFVRDAMKTTIKLILNNTEEEVQDFIQKFKNEFKNQKPEDIAFPRGVNKLEETYCDVNGEFLSGKTVPINSRAGIMYNRGIDKLDLDLQKIMPADKIKYIHIELPNMFHSNVIGFHDVLPKEFRLHDKIDYNLMFEKTFLKPMRDIVELIGWSAEPIATIDFLFGD